MSINNDEAQAYIPIRDAKALLGLGYKTLRTYIEEDRIEAYKTSHGQWRFSKDSCKELAGIGNLTSSQFKQSYIYCRVSSKIIQ